MTDEDLQLDELKQEARIQLAEKYREQFTAELDAFVRERCNMMMSNEHYEAATTGMLTALTRVMSQCTVAWAETYGIERHKAQLACQSQLQGCLNEAYDALDAGLAPQGEPN
jgi:hypothetical protein